MLQLNQPGAFQAIPCACKLSFSLAIHRGTVALLSPTRTQMLLRRLSLDRVSWVDIILGFLRIGILVAVVAGSISTIASGKYTVTQWGSLVAAGVAQGSIYALIALGYTLVYGILRMINFAHGEVFMFGAYVTAYFALWTARHDWLANSPYLTILSWVLLAALVSTGVAVLVERVAYKPLRGKPRLVTLISAIGVSFFLQYTARSFFGSGFISYPDMPILRGRVEVGPFAFPSVQLGVLVMALVLMAILYWLVEKTRMGRAMRAVSEDMEVSRLMGVDTEKVILFTFALGGALAGAAGVFNGLYKPQGVNFFMGFFPGIKAFTAAVLGGIGSVPGALLGGLVLGIIESVGPNLVLDGLGIPAANQLKDAIAYLMLVFILIFRPQGILGEKIEEEKA